MRPAIPDPTSRLLRYRFDSAVQLRRHCRFHDGRILLFFPDPNPPLVFGRTLLELAFERTGQQVVVPAMIQGRAAGGLWLELRALSVVAGLQSALVGPRRSARRLAADLVAYIRSEENPVLACPVVDLSPGGARIWGLPGQRRGELVTMRIAGWPELEARVVWTSGKESGVEFTGASREAAQGMFGGVEGLWSKARAASHDAACPCLRGGEPRDPPAPHTALPERARAARTGLQL